MVLKTVCNVFCAANPCPWLRTKFFFSHREEKKHLTLNTICCRDKQIEVLPLIFFVLIFIFWLKSIQNRYEETLGLSFRIKFGCIFFFFCLVSLFSSIMSLALPICRMSDTELKLIVKCIGYLCACWKKMCIFRCLPLIDEVLLAAMNWKFLKQLCKWIRHLQTQTWRSVQSTLFLTDKN